MQPSGLLQTGQNFRVSPEKINLYKFYPFAVSFDEFAKLSVNEQRKLRHQTLLQNRDWIDQKLAEHNAEWILVLGGVVERSSTSLDELSSKQEIYQIAEQKGFAPFAFVKDALLE